MSDPNFALYWADDAYLLDGKIMGRQSAGAGFLRAVAQAAPQRVVCAAYARASAIRCWEALQGLGAREAAVDWVRLGADGVTKLSRIGALYRPDPKLAREAWRRAPFGSGAYSLIGVTHTLSTRHAQQAMADLATGPVEPWDALICTSQAAREVVRRVMDDMAEHLARRCDGRRPAQPELPIIPLGVHTADFDFSNDDRQRARSALGVSEAEVVVLYAGRLTPVKANVLPLLLALERAARGRPVTLLQAGVFSHPAIGASYRADVRKFCPSVRCEFVSGDTDAWRDAWAAADIFTSLVDSVQETFGLTPLEAMAAGLPSVVSDWNGYKDTVRDGVDGLRIPTIMPAGGATGFMAQRYFDDDQSPESYLLDVSSMIAVDVDAAASAFDRLISDPDLRRRMGRQARARAREQFDWAGVYRRYVDLVEELGDRRRSAGGGLAALDPVLQDPFRLFAGFSTDHLSGDVRLVLATGEAIAAADRVRESDSATYASATPPKALVDSILSTLSSGEPFRVDDLLCLSSSTPRAGVQSTLIWLLKYGVLRIAADGGPRSGQLRD